MKLYHYQVISSCDPTDVIVDSKEGKLKPVSYEQAHINGEAALKAMGVLPEIYYVKAIPA